MVRLESAGRGRGLLGFDTWPDNLGLLRAFERSLRSANRNVHGLERR